MIKKKFDGLFDDFVDFLKDVYQVSSQNIDSKCLKYGGQMFDFRINKSRLSFKI